jgi:hypothetical protein
MFIGSRVFDDAELLMNKLLIMERDFANRTIDVSAYGERHCR